MSAHAYLPPSGAGCWVKCSAWPTINRDYPNETTPEAEEGTAMHELAEKLLVLGSRGMHTPAETFIGHTFNSVAMDSEMVEAVQVYVDHCINMMRAHGVFGGSLLSIESRVAIERVHRDCWGTLDFGMYLPEKRTLHIVDFKGGRRYVDEYECWQLICYALGLLDRYKIDGQLDQVTDVVMTIVQPRCYGADKVRSWTVKASELRGYANTLADAANRIEAGEMIATTGTHCRFCPGKLNCDAWLRSLGNAIDVSAEFSTINLSDAQLGASMDAVEQAFDRLDQAKDALEEQIKARLKAGHPVGLYGLEPTTGRAKWGRPIEEVKALGAMLGKKLTKEVPITPNQAEKLGVDSSIIKAYSAPVQHGTKLTKFTQRKLERLFK